MYFFVNYKSSLAAGFDVQNIPQDGIVLLGQLRVNVVQILCSDEFYLGDDVVLVAEINDPLSVRHPSDDGAGDTETLEQELKVADCVGLQGSSYLNTDTLGRLKHSHSDHSSVSIYIATALSQSGTLQWSEIQMLL